MAIPVSTDTDLSAVNSILGSIGQAPITTLTHNPPDPDPLLNPEIGFIVSLLKEVNKDVQSTGWHFNTQYNVKRDPDSSKHFVIPTNAIAYDLHDNSFGDRTKDITRRDGKLFDLVANTDEFEGTHYFDIITLYNFEDVPPVIQRYIIARASVRAAVQLVSNSDLVKLLKMEEEQAKANALNYETEQGDNSFFGFDSNTSYRPYQPYKALIR